MRKPSQYEDSLVRRRISAIEKMALYRLEWVNERASDAPTPQPTWGLACIAGSRILSNECGRLLATQEAA